MARIAGVNLPTNKRVVIALTYIHGIGAGCGEHPLALAKAGEAKRRGVGLEVAHRMRIEGRDDHGLALMRAARHRASHHRLMAEVETVEIAKRDDRAAQGVGNRPVVGQALHVESSTVRHCEEHSDEAIQFFRIKAGLLRSARNGGFCLLDSGGPNP